MRTTPSPPTIADLERRLRAEGLTPHAWSNGPGDRYGAHVHDYDKVLVVEAGSITFLLDAGPVQLEAGDRLDVPAGTRHAAEVGSRGVTCLEAHLPAGTLAGPARADPRWADRATDAATDGATDGVARTVHDAGS